MKTLFCILIIISIIGCNGMDKSAKKELTKEQKSIIESIVSFADSIGGKSRSSSTMLSRIAAIKANDVEFLNFYYFDMDKFYEDPTPENLLLSLYQPDDFAMLVVQEKARNSYALTTKKQKSKWVPNAMMHDFGEKILHVKSKSPNVENSDFRIFQFEALYFYTYTSKGERVYEDMRGNVFTPGMMCDRLLTVINAIKQAAEEGNILYL